MMNVSEYKKIRFEGESKDEETLFFLRAHPITNLSWIIMSVVAIFLPISTLIFFVIATPIEVPISIETVVLGFGAWYLVVFGVALQQFISWFFNIYILTNKQIVDIDFFGLFHRNVSQTTLGNVQDVTYSKAGIFQNFFDYGNLFLQTAGTQLRFEFHSVPDPEGVQKQILNLVAKYKRRGRNIHGEQPNRLI